MFKPRKRKHSRCKLCGVSRPKNKFWSPTGFLDFCPDCLESGLTLEQITHMRDHGLMLTPRDYKPDRGRILELHKKYNSGKNSHLPYIPMEMLYKDIDPDRCDAIDHIVKNFSKIYDKFLDQGGFDAIGWRDMLLKAFPGVVHVDLDGSLSLATEGLPELITQHPRPIESLELIRLALSLKRMKREDAEKLCEMLIDRIEISPHLNVLAGRLGKFQRKVDYVKPDPMTRLDDYCTPFRSFKGEKLFSGIPFLGETDLVVEAPPGAAAPAPVEVPMLERDQPVWVETDSLRLDPRLSDLVEVAANATERPKEQIIQIARSTIIWDSGDFSRSPWGWLFEREDPEKPAIEIIRKKIEKGQEELIALIKAMKA